MRWIHVLFSGLLIFATMQCQAKSIAPPPANASAVDVVKFTVAYESQAGDASQLLRGDSMTPTPLESRLFTHDLLTGWYATKVKESTNPDAGNVTNGDSDYIMAGGQDGPGPHDIKFKDMSNKPNGVMVLMTYKANGPYSRLFFLKQEGGALKIDDIMSNVFIPDATPFDPNKPHHPGVSEGLRRDLVNFKSIDEGTQ